MELLVVIGVGLSASMIRIYLSKRSGKSKKLRYYNYTKYTIRHKKIGQSLNEQSKTTF